MRSTFGQTCWRPLRALFILALFIWSHALCAAAQDARASYRNPVIEGDFPDPTVIRVGRDYWAAATTGGWAPHFTILHSRDLVNWKPVGAVLRTAPRWARGDFWAPEMSEHNGRFYVYYTARRNDGPNKRGTLCVAVAAALLPQGPYTDYGPLVCQDIGSIDAMAVRDENNRRYLVWKEDGNDRNQPTPIWAQRLTDDGLRLTGERKEILRNTEAWERHVTEGSFIIRRDGWFYHFYSGNACCGRECKYALGVARSRKLLGPWEKNPANPILAANDRWQCPGHGSIVTTTDGRLFMLYHAYRKHRSAFNVGREALLDEISWRADGWPAINDGRGPSSVAPLPLKIQERRGESGFFDDFTAARLDPAWQWPMNHAQKVSIDSGRNGSLLLSPQGTNRDNWTSAVLARRTTSGDYVATLRLDPGSSGAGVRAGLTAYSWRASAVGVAVGGGKLYVWRREGAKEETLETKDAPRASSIYLRMKADEGAAYSFSYSVNGRDWTPLGGPVDAGYIEGARVALTAGGPAGTVARFDWLRVEPEETSTN